MDVSFMFTTFIFDLTSLLILTGLPSWKLLGSVQHFYRCPSSQPNYDQLSQQSIFPRPRITMKWKDAPHLTVGVLATSLGPFTNITTVC